jgi:predicted SnoaL-like aldol condensation-catalyzing enzyme
MSQTTESTNKALVLEAFDTLFNMRDCAAAERFWSSNYVQHSATSRRAAMVSSTSSRVLPRLSSTSRA